MKSRLFTGRTTVILASLLVISAAALYFIYSGYTSGHSEVLFTRDVQWYETMLGKYSRELLEEERTNCISSCIADLDNDGFDEILQLTASDGSEYGKELVIYSNDKDSARYNLESLKPWKVQVCDVDGDGALEISIGVYKMAKFHPVMAKRPFIYGWDKEGIWPKWLGSRLSRPFEDYAFLDADKDGMDELVAIELLEDGRKVLNLYKWKGFGFEGIGESGSFKDIAGLAVTDGKSTGKPVITAKVMESNEWQLSSFSYRDGKIFEQGEVR